MSDTVDLYTQRPGEAIAPPTRLTGRIKHLGPSIIVSGSIVGSGEIILTAGLGAAAGFVLLWWVLVSCWSKSIVQAEISRYVITSGDTYLRALNRLPGRIPGPWGPFAWPIGLGLLAFVPGVLGLSGIVGSAGQSLQLLVDIDPIVATAIISIGAMVVLGTGGYLRLERTMLVFVIGFTVLTIVCAVLMQFTEYRMTLEDVKSGFTFDFPPEYFVIALAMYGYTGVNSGETSAYTYWCVEKGYPSFIGPDRDDPQWVERAKGWIKVLHTDVWVTLVLLTCATLPFYFLGAGVLHRLGETPQGLDTVRVLSNMFTQTLGTWSLWVFGIGAFFILFSTVLSGMAAGARFIPEYLIELGIIERAKVQRKLWIRGYVLSIPILSFILYMTFQSPVLLVTIGAITAALFLPIQSGATLWLQRHHMDQRVRPSTPMHIALWSVFVFQSIMALAVIWYVVLD